MRDNKDRYIEQLERVIKEELYPIYEAYYATNGLPKPKLELPFLKNTKKIPALLCADF